MKRIYNPLILSKAVKGDHVHACASRTVEKNGIVYLPVYYCMFYEFDKADENECIIPEIKL